MTTKGSENRFPSLTVVGQASDPVTPGSGDFKLFVADDGTFYLMDDTGTKVDLTAGGFSDPMTTRGDIMVRNASNVTARLAKGSAGTFLGSDGTDPGYTAVTDALLSTSDITTNNASTSKHGFLKKLDNNAAHFMDGTGAWSTPSGGSSGGSPLLAVVSVTAAATLDVTTRNATGQSGALIQSDFDVYEVVLADFLPATDNVDFYVRMSTGGSFDTGSNYTSDASLIASSGNVGYVAGGATAFVWARNNGEIKNTSTRALHGRYTIWNARSTAKGKRFAGNTYWEGNGNWINTILDGFWNNTGAMDGIRFYFSSGNVATGTAYIYGMQKS
jgi:hypothetical protein